MDDMKAYHQIGINFSSLNSWGRAKRFQKNTVNICGSVGTVFTIKVINMGVSFNKGVFFLFLEEV